MTLAVTFATERKNQNKNSAENVNKIDIELKRTQFLNALFSSSRLHCADDEERREAAWINKTFLITRATLMCLLFDIFGKFSSCFWVFVNRICRCHSIINVICDVTRWSSGNAQQRTTTTKTVVCMEHQEEALALLKADIASLSWSAVPQSLYQLKVLEHCAISDLPYVKTG